MTIGLTGARGVLGRRLVEVLDARGTRVTPFDGDVRDAAALAEWATGCERIVHAAAIVPTIQVKEGTGTAIAVNVAGTANVATAAAAAGVPLTYISTSHVYASSDGALAEDAPVRPVSLYGLTKWQGEQWVNQLAPAPLIVRLFSYFDSRQAASFLVPALYRRIREAPKGAELPLYGYGSVRDMADARWLAGRLADLIESGASGTLNLGTGVGTSIATVAARLALAVGRDDISWTPADDHPGDTLVADVTAVSRAVEMPAFDLDAAFRALAADSAS